MMAIPSTTINIKPSTILEIMSATLRPVDIAIASFYLLFLKNFADCEYERDNEKVLVTGARRRKFASCLLLPAYCRLSLHDPSAADNFIAAIEDRRLARRDRALRFVELDPSATVR